MDQYVTGTMIRTLREKKQLTQAELAQQLTVSDKAVSKWETGRGYPDISLIAPLAAALGVSVQELLSGSSVTNHNRSFNMLRSCAYVCPVCGNVLVSAGEAMISCCGVTLHAMEAEASDADHRIHVQVIEDEYYVTVDHPMTKEHYISFLAAVSDCGFQLVKLYPEGSAAAYFPLRGTRFLYACCNHHGLFSLAPARR